MDKYYLAIDIGASSGRHIIGYLKEGKIYIEEIYRFSNGMRDVKGKKIWDIELLFEEVIKGMRKCRESGKIPVSLGIDTWGVDFVLLDKDDRRIGDAVAYRDERTEGMEEYVYKSLSKEELYELTGIQKQSFNSIYQMMALKEKEPKILKSAKTFLMIPDYLNFLLSGVKAQEYTNATTTQLVNVKTGDWDFETIKKLGYPENIFLPISEPGTFIGNLSEEIKEKVGFDCKVVLPPTHDTASAVAAVPGNEENILYISSGTWSLMGTELREANCTKEAMLHNFTNEGGYNRKYRFLKNIMGLWMIQEVRKELAKDLSFGDICDMAANCDIESLVDANDHRFLAPKSMYEEIQRACEETKQKVPQGIAQVGAVIYNSLAKCYGKTLNELEALTGQHYESINVVGGGSKADYLNKLTAKYTKRRVFAGPAEATAIGNLAIQMIAEHEFKDIKDARSCILDSFEIKQYFDKL